MRPIFILADPFSVRDGEVEIDLTNPKVQEAIAAAVAEATGGLKKNRDDILKEKSELADRIKAMEDQWKGMDPAMVRTLVERMQNDEETKLIAEGKIDEVIARRTDAMKRDYEARLEAATGKVSETETAIGDLKGKIKNLVLEGQVREAATKLGLVPTAIEDAISRASRLFELDDNDKPIARDEHGTLKMGKDGKSPLDPAGWLEAQREQAPHWFPAPTGTGAGGGNGPGGKPGVHQISRSDARNPQAYQAAKESAQKAGATLQIVE